MVIYQVVMRMGWIFKTESVIMPAVLDFMGGAGWLRGCLPMFNRFGQSVPPLLMSRRIKVMPQKSRAVAICTSMMAFSFLALSVIWMNVATPQTWWMPIVFLAFYAFFFINTGINQIAFNTVQGKLVRVNRRGRLLLLASVLGGLVSIVAALLLLPIWLRPTDANFGMIFGFAGLAFAGSALASLFLREQPDNFQQPRHPFIEHFSNAARIIRQDRNLRRLAIVAALFGTSMMLFPHYQALGRIRLSLTMDNLIWYVVLQNAGTALFSLPAGGLADRCGNRLVLRIALLAICCAPVSALVLAQLDAVGPSLYFMIFLLVGLTPVTLKTLINYTLEICDSEDHPRYLSTISLCVALPVFCSPLVGWFVDLFSFEAVFITITVLVFLGWLLTFSLQEPRHHVTDLNPVAVDSE